MSDQERLTKFSNEWRNNHNCVTRAAYRAMYLRLYFSLYCW